MIQLQANIREAYLELQENRVKESIQNYLLNAGVSETQIEELEADGSFNELIQNLREGDCNIENIARIRSFNEAHFPEHDLTLTEEDARNIL